MLTSVISPMFGLGDCFARFDVRKLLKRNICVAACRL